MRESPRGSNCAPRCGILNLSAPCGARASVASLPAALHAARDRRSDPLADRFVYLAMIPAQRLLELAEGLDLVRAAAEVRLDGRTYREILGQRRQDEIAVGVPIAFRLRCPDRGIDQDRHIDQRLVG